MMEWGAGGLTEIAVDGPPANFRAGVSRRSIRWRSRGRSLISGSTQVLVIALATLELCAVVAGIASPFPGGLARLKFAGPSTFAPEPVEQGGYLSAFTDYEVTMYCDNGEIYEAVKGDPVLCDNGQGGGDYAAGDYALGAVPNSGYQFSSWSATGDVKMSGSTMEVSGTGTVTATFTACSGISINSVSSPVHYGYPQAWVNFSYTSGAAPSLSWGTNNATYPDPTPTIGNGTASYDLNDLVAGTTYDYTATITGHCAETVQKSGSFTSTGAMPIIDGSNDSFQNKSTTVSTDLTTNLTHSLIVVELINSQGSGKVTGCADADGYVANWTQRKAFNPSSGSPWIFEWYGESANKLTNDKISCTYSVSTNQGMIVFGVANADLTSPYDTGSSIPCTDENGPPEVICALTTTEPDDLVLGLVATYHTSGSPAIAPGGGFRQIKQKDVGPYAMAEFFVNATTPGTYDPSANDSGVSGLGIIGDAVASASYVGWVYPMVSNSSLLDQIGSSPISGAAVWPNAKCYSFFPAGVSPDQSLGVTSGPVNLTATKTGSDGYYQLDLPISESYTVGYFTGGTKGYEVTDNITTTLYAGGSCTSTVNGATYGSISNPHIQIFSEHVGSWNATEYVSATHSATNGLYLFGLPADASDVAPMAIAFVHTQYAECQVTTATTTNQTINAYLAGSGYSYTSGTGVGETNLQGYGNDSSISWHYSTTGVINETVGPTVEATYAISGPYNPDLGLSYTDPNSTIPASSSILTIQPGGKVDALSFYNGGSYAAATGLDIAVGLSFAWDGISPSPGAYVDLGYVTTETVSASKEIFCSFQDPSSSEPAQFYYYLDGSESAIGEAINVHIWFDDVE